MRRRLEPLRVRPFGRLLGSYTVNDLGDSIGVVALAVLVFERTNSVAPTAGFFLVAKFLPALFATGLTARLDQISLRRSLPAIYVLEALVFAALAFFAIEGRFFLPLVLLLGMIDGTLAITGRGLTRGGVAAALQPHGLIAEGNALMNLGFAASSVFGAALAGLLIAAFGVSVALLVDAASFLVIAVWLITAKEFPRLEHTDYRPWHARFRAGLVVRGLAPARPDAADRPVAGADLLHARRPDRGHLREGVARDHQRRVRHPRCRPGAPASCSAACSSSCSRTARGSR